LQQQTQNTRIPGGLVLEHFAIARAAPATLRVFSTSSSGFNRDASDPPTSEGFRFLADRTAAIIRTTIANIITTIIRTGEATGATTVIGTTTMMMIKLERF
jgi:hypothetical protein